MKKLKSQFKFRSNDGEDFFFSEENGDPFEEVTDKKFLKELEKQTPEWEVYSWNPT